MKAKKRDNFKKVLKLADGDGAPADFTNAIMGIVEAEAKSEIALKALLQKEEAVGPNFSFTANVMAGISESKRHAIIIRPIITKKAWAAIAVVGVVFLVLLFLSNKPSNNPTDSNLIIKTINYTYAIPPVYLMALVIAVVLLLADYLITRLKGKTQAA